ncbi:MAG: AAA family ATPase [Pyrinomonadaceae bacterium]
MTFSLHESIDPNGAYEAIEQVYRRPAVDVPREEFPLLREKLRMPQTAGYMDRPRLTSLLTKSTEQFPATLISGRAGTGKTAIAANFAQNKTRVAWNTVESTDISWAVFSRYFSESLKSIGSYVETEVRSLDEQDVVSQTEIARLLVKHFAHSYAHQAPALIVLDDIHHIFDAVWFDEFLNLLLYSLPPGCHALLLSRSKPPSPLWRLRSKQMLNVIEERVIAFTADETQQLFNAKGAAKRDATRAHKQSFGRVSKLLQFIN